MALFVVIARSVATKQSHTSQGLWIAPLRTTPVICLSASGYRDPCTMMSDVALSISRRDRLDGVRSANRLHAR